MAPAPQHKNQAAYMSCKSIEKIPFLFTKTQQDVLRKGYYERFNIQDNVAYLCLASSSS